MKRDPFLYIGTAGWSLPRELQMHFPEEGTHLQRYSRVFNCVEINSSFYRDHKPETYFKWASVTAKDFRFSVKLSRYFTQSKRLKDCGEKLAEVLLGIGHLREKWGALLVQLPPSLEFDQIIAEKFIGQLRKLYLGPICWEPRHRSWGEKKATDLLHAYSVSKVLADPEPCPLSSAQRSLVETTRYYRLHGTPEIYKSRYSLARIQSLAGRVKSPAFGAEQTWCVFDNTTFGYAINNALELKLELLKWSSRSSSSEANQWMR